MKSMGKSSMMSKSSKGKGRYEDVDLPLCSELSEAPTPTPAPTTVARRTTCQGILNGADPGGTPSKQAPIVFVLVGTFTSSDATLLAKLEERLRVLLAIAVGCNVDFSFGRRLADYDPETRIYMQGNKLNMLTVAGKQGSLGCA